MIRWRAGGHLHLLDRVHRIDREGVTPEKRSQIIQSHPNPLLAEFGLQQMLREEPDEIDAGIAIGTDHLDDAAGAVVGDGGLDHGPARLPIQRAADEDQFLIQPPFAVDGHLDEFGGRILEDRPGAIVDV